jgi:CBS domain containing-hemolysin-like protein
MWAICLGLLVIRGLLGAADTALTGVSDLRARELKDDHPRRGRRLLRLKTERESTAAALRFGMVLSGFTAAAIATLVPPRLLGVTLTRLGDFEWMAWMTPLLSALLVALLATIVDVVFRSTAGARPEAWALTLSSLVSLCVGLLYPVVRLLVVPLNLVLAPFGQKVSFQAPPLPLDELEKLLTVQASQKQVDKSAPQLIRSIFELSAKTCRDVMVPRTDAVAVDISTPPSEILGMIAEKNHSRIPVYEGDVDKVVGILHVRDLVPLMQNPVLIVLQDLIRPAVFVPWVKPIGDLLREMQGQKIHMAVVVDEYGGFMGIVTLEDILREIVGDIGDEFEQETKPFEKQPDGTFLVDAMLPPQDFARAFDFKLPEGEYETLGGFLSSMAGAIPEAGEKYIVNGWTFIVHSKEGPRLDRIRVIKPRLTAAEKKEPAGELLPPRPSPAR